ncbi:uncharacterized protein LOC117291497 isoform X3 [Asterias rubens]|uniref:uncharacterized protein LOC117291497 isoform X3 n=1 Tax=Asterias rubens TaxID=7604 RepID=UPI001454FD11|nr:uncharacterized protein LOC117291497 isoform X3 [Asterias rubens]
MGSPVEVHSLERNFGHRIQNVSRLTSSHSGCQHILTMASNNAVSVQQSIYNRPPIVFATVHRYTKQQLLDLRTPSSWAIFSSLIFTGSVYYFLVTSQITLPSTETKPPVDEWRDLVTTSPGPGQFAINNKPIDSSKNSSSPGKYFRNYISFLNEESLEHNMDKRNEFFVDTRSKTEIFLINWMTERQINIFEDIHYRYVILLAHLYPAVKFFRFTAGKVGKSIRMFFEKIENKTKEMHHKPLSTGWHTLVAALELCDQVTVYGMVPPTFCNSKSNYTSKTKVVDVPYHYYPPHLRKNDCRYLLLSEKANETGHPFLTEKQAIKRLRKNSNVTFRHPQWNES